TLIGEECRLDLLSKAARGGKKQVTSYFANYSKQDVRLAVGRAEGREVLGAFEPPDAMRASYIIALDFQDDRVVLIRDWRYVPYLIAELDFTLGAAPQ